MMLQLDYQTRLLGATSLYIGRLKYDKVKVKTVVKFAAHTSI